MSWQQTVKEVYGPAKLGNAAKEVREGDCFFMDLDVPQAS
jgi:hypothetical protein